MTDTRYFVILITLLLGGGFLLPIMANLLRLSWRWRERLSTGSMWLSLAGSITAAMASSRAWWFSPDQPLTISLNLWHGMGDGLVSIPPLLISFHLDRLSSFFTLLISCFSALVIIYSFSALKAVHYQRYRRQIVSAYSLFLWATIMTVVAYDVFSLLLMLEIATLAFAYLALYKHIFYQDGEQASSTNEEQHKNAQIAPQVYLAISHTSTAFLLIALIILALKANDINFTAIMENRLPASKTSTVVFLLALAGLGIRAGLTPGHIWVSLVHPSSPTTTHAFSLGIGIKVAIYLMYRFFFQFLEPQMWWGCLFLLVAAVTALINVWYAIYSHDLKTALAYHSVENIGIICVGIGVAMIFYASRADIAVLGLVASLYHLLNHAVFKGLLYLSTGAIDNLTHQTVEFDRLGGLVKVYPFTSAMFIVGALSISGFPPFNGFISEWLTLQSLFKGLADTNSFSYSRLIAILSALSLLAASFALTVFCFYKMVGVSFLGLPRSPEYERKQWESNDVSLIMKFVMGIMAIFSLVLGISSRIVIPWLGLTIESLGIFHLGIPPPAGYLTFTLPLTSLLILALLFGVILIFFNLRRPVKRPEAAWNCGAPLTSSSSIQFTSSSSSFLLRTQFIRGKSDKRSQVFADYLPAWLTLSSSKTFPQRIPEIFRVGYNIIIHVILSYSEWFGKTVQNRDNRRYLWYIFFANLIVLITFILIRDGSQ